MSDEYDLAKSSKKLGPLVPILKDAKGNIIDGFHRQNANPDWPTITVESVDSDAKLELARLATNFCRRKLEPSEIQNRLTFLVGKCGMKPEEIAEQTGISLTTIYKYLPQELKDEKKVEAGQASGVARSVPSAEHTVKTQDMVQCEYCHIASSDIQTETVNSKPRKLCVRCQGNLVLAPERFTAFFRNVNGESKAAEHEPAPKPLYTEKWEHKLGTMKVQHSKPELDYVQGLRNRNLGQVTTDQAVYVVPTFPDANLELASGKVAYIYVNMPETHDGKQKDKDERLQFWLKKKEPDALIVNVDLKTGSAKEIAEKLDELEESLKW